MNPAGPCGASRVGDNIADIAIEGGHLISGTKRT